MRVAAESGAASLAMFHHDPLRSDAQVDLLLAEARDLAAARSSGPDVLAAFEGLALRLAPAAADHHVSDADPAREPAFRKGASSFREVLGHFATGVAVVTAVDDGTPVGMAANSFTSVSLDPPLVLFCAAKTSTTWPRIERAPGFSVNILSDRQEELSRVFATKGADRFRGVAWTPGASGAPVLDGVLAHVDCIFEAEHEAGDHVIVVGRVLDLGIAAEAGPLLFHRGGYGRLLS